MRALILNCTLKSSPETSNTEALLDVVAEALRGHGIDVDVVRIVDHDVKPGVTNDEGGGDEWPAVPTAQHLDSCPRTRGNEECG